MERRRRIAVFGGAAAAVQNSEPLVTSNKARAQYGLAPLRKPDGSAPVKVYVEQFSAR
jgi:L-asparaginase